MHIQVQKSQPRDSFIKIFYSLYLVLGQVLLMKRFPLDIKTASVGYNICWVLGNKNFCGHMSKRAPVNSENIMRFEMDYLDLQQPSVYYVH